MTGRSCPVCGTTSERTFLEIATAPVFCNVLSPTAEEARAAPTGEIALHACTRCGMVWNAAFDEARVEYAPGYENSLHFSGVFQGYAEELAERLVARHGLRGKRVVELGSGTGEFLALLCADGVTEGVGYDPSYSDDAGAGATSSSVRFVRGFYTASAAAAEPPDLVVSRHVLEHVADPLAFLRELREGLRAAPHAVVYLEVPAADSMLRDEAVWDVIYEHPSYFTAPALRTLFEATGFRVLAEGLGYGDQYRWVEAVPGDARKGVEAADEAEVRAIGATAATFGDAFRRRVAAWDERLLERAGNGGVALWGAGSKGVTFLNSVPGARRIPTVVDLNPRKHGRHVPGTGQVISPPDALGATRVHTVIGMNPLYSSEIGRHLVSLGVQAEVEVV